jgi:CubicO group peptidase (beta-lactamase class C family)
VRRFYILFLLILNSFNCISGEAEIVLNKDIVATQLNILYDKIKARKNIPAFETTFLKLRKNFGFNGSVLISVHDQTIYKGAFGYANLENRDTLNSNSIFQLASVSKQFTAAAIILLEEKGFLEFTDYVTRFYPKFPYKNIRIQDLLAHRSGLPDYRWFIDTLWTDKEKPISNQKMMKLFELHAPNLYFTPNTRHSYSNTGYAVLSAIVESITKLKFSEFMKLAFFKPIGMNNTSIYSKCESEIQPGNVTGYEKNGRWKAPNDCFNGITGDKNVFSSVEDLFLWDQELYNGRIIQLKNIEKAYMPANPELKGWRNYGFGWRINQTNPAKKVVYHTGWWRGYRTFFMRNLSDHSSIIILSNTVNYSLNSLQSLYSLVIADNLDSLSID